MDNIYIFDDFLEDDELSRINKFILETRWSYGHRNGEREPIDTRYFSDYNINSFISDYVRIKIEKVINKPLKIIRNYLQIQSFGENGGYHTDCDMPNTYTFTLYITEIDNETIEHSNGDFLLKLPNVKHIVSIDTYNNRGIVFPSNYLHKGMAYNINTTKKRIVIAWKFEEIL